MLKRGVKWRYYYFHREPTLRRAHHMLPGPCKQQAPDPRRGRSSWIRALIIVVGLDQDSRGGRMPVHALPHPMLGLVVEQVILRVAVVGPLEPQGLPEAVGVAR